MFCMYCGKQVPDEANFCFACGKPIVNPEKANSKPDNNKIKQAVPEIKALDYSKTTSSTIDNKGAKLVETVSTPGQTINSQNADIQGLINSSINFMQTSTNGYYCFYCGDYVDYRKIRAAGMATCPSCGCHAVGLKEATMSDGWGLRLINSILGENQDPYLEIKDYYNSVYFKNTGYPFETVALDRGLVGEYMLDMEFKKLSRKRAGKPCYMFYNVLIPEPNGSFQEVDAILFYGSNIILIEAKNRAGRYQYQHMTDKYWTLINESGKTEIHSPLLQNDQHIAALMYYYNEKSAEKRFHFNISRNQMFNQVFLGIRGEFNTSIQPDEYDYVVLDEMFSIVFGPGLSDHLASLLDHYDQIGTGYTCDDNAKKNIEILKEILYQSQSDKELFKRNREADHNDKGKTDFHYYYISTSFLQRIASGSVTREKGMLVRTNGVYTQYMDDVYYGWQMGARIQYENGSFIIGGDFFPDNAVVYDLKNMPVEIVNAKRCVQQKIIYKKPE